MRFENLIESYSKIIKNKVVDEPYIKYSLWEIDYIKYVYSCSRKEISKTVSYLKTESEIFKKDKNFARFNSQRLFLEIYNRTKDF